MHILQIKNLLKYYILWFLLLFFLPSVLAQERPNVILILADDLGWSDLSCYGNPIIQTPNIDQLAKEGMRFTNAYADPVCAPSRAALQTGQYSAKLKMSGVPNGHRRPYAKLIPPSIYWRLALEHNTIAEVIKEAGYVSGIFGKWHLGYDDEHQPKDQGYETPENIAFNNAYADELNTWIQANPEKGTGGIFKRCIQFIEQHKDEPFFCIASFSAVHTKPEARKELVDKYKKIVSKKRTVTDPVYAAMCEVLDESVGHFRKVLQALNLDKETLILFYSDNGGVVEERGFLFNGYPNLVTNNWPLKNEKGSLYEGGIRVPMIAHWPNQIEAGSTNDNLIHCIDFFPTLLELTNSEKPKGIEVDGISILPFLKDKNLSVNRDIFWHYPHYHHSTPASAIRSGDYKLIHFYETKTYELYNLKEDISEQYDISKIEKGKAQELYVKLKNWIDYEVSADLPKENPFYDPKRQLLWGERMDNSLYKKGLGYGLEHDQVKY